MPNTSELFTLDLDIWTALSGKAVRISQKRIDMIANALKEQQERRTHARREIARLSLENSDLRTHLRDRDRYIKILEAELMPYRRDAWQQPAIQEVMPEA